MTNLPKDTKPTKRAKPIIDLGADLSPALTAIERAVRLFAKAYPDTPPITVVIKRDERAWGHTTVAKVWANNADAATATRFEVMISGENLRRGAEPVAATLLHELAHARNLANGVLDTDVNGRHNKKWAATAREHGLNVVDNGWKGYSHDALTDEGKARWANLIKVVAAGIAKSAAPAAPDASHIAKPKAVTGAPEGDGSESTPVAPRKRGNRNLIKAVCECGHAIRLSQGVLDKARPPCQACQSPFEPVLSL